MFTPRTEKLASLIRPRRSIPGSARPPTARQVSGALAKLTKGYGKVGRTFKAALDADKDRHLEPLRRAVHDLMGQLSLESLAAAEPDVVAGALVVAMRADFSQSLVPALVAARGLVSAVELSVASGKYSLDSDGSWVQRVFLIEGSSHYRRPDMEPLRVAVCAASNAEYALARDRASALRAGLVLDRRAELAFAFPDEPWANEDLAETTTLATRPYGGWLLLSAVTDPAVARAALALDDAGIGNVAIDLAAALPEADVVPLLAESLPALLTKPKYGPLLKTPPRMVVDALSCFRSEAAAAVLAPYVGNNILGPQVAEYFRDFPELLPILEQGASGKAARQVVGSITSGLEAASADVRRAAPDAVPSVLRDRPWRPRKRKTAKAVALELSLPIDLQESLDPAFLAQRFDDPVAADEVRDMTAAELAAWRKGVAAGTHSFADFEWVRTPGKVRWIRIPFDDGLAAWNQGNAGPHGDVRAMFQRFGVAGIEGLLHRPWWNWMTYDDGPAYLEACLAVRSPRLAPMFATTARRKTLRGASLGWLAADPHRAVIGLVPTACGEAGSARDDAREALLALDRLGHGDAVREATTTYGDAALAQIVELLSADPLAIDAKAPKPPALLRAEELPPLLTRGGGALPPEAVLSLLEMLSAVPTLPPYAGAALVADALEPDSLDAWLCALFDQWVLGGGGGREDWMVHAFTVFDAPATTRRVCEQLRSWSSSKKANAERLADALATVGSDPALMQLAHVAESSRFAALRVHVRTLLAQIAARRGLTPDELADRTVPELGLDANGQLRLSYGERKFTVHLDESLQIAVYDDGGASHRTLPRPRQTDDAAAAKVARQQYDELKKDLAAIADRQTRRLEAAMRSRRQWSAAEFAARIVGHRLVRHLARGLIWQIPDGPAFRVAEDGSFADLHDDHFALAADAAVRLAHPLDLGPDLPTWRERLADYERVPPFDQLGRPVYTPTEAERGARTLSRTAGGPVPGTKLIGWMERRGWRRDSAGNIGAWLCSVGTADGPVEVRLPIHPGIEIAYLQHDTGQTLRPLELPVAAGGLDPVGFSELLADVSGLLNGP